MFTIKSVTGKLHDTCFGGYPFKVVVMVDVDAKEYAKLPVLSRAQNTIRVPRTAVRDLGSLVLGVNNAVYAINASIPAHNPSIDSTGGNRAKNGVKTMEFIYFFKDCSKARELGFKFIGNTDIPEYSQYVKIA